MMQNSAALDKTAALRAVESLRSGVPNSFAVRMLGTNQVAIVNAYDRSLGNTNTSVTDQQGFLIEGGFGAGKSHVLTILQQRAFEKNFACSMIAISKETTLAAIPSLFYAAIRDLRLADKNTGGSCAEFLDRIKFNSKAFAEMLLFYTNTEDFDPIFGATLQVFERYQDHPDVLDWIIDFWDGERCKIADVRAALKAVGLPYQHLRQPADSRMGLQRFDFVGDLLRCAGYSGWIVLIDEAELIAKLSLLARTRSYVNLASLFKCSDFRSPHHVHTFAAITDDLLDLLFGSRNDAAAIDLAVRPRHANLAEYALRAIEFLRSECRRYEIQSLDAAELTRVRDRVREVYEAAYPDFTLPPAVEVVSPESSRSMRLYIKEWVTDLDLRRLYPGHEPVLHAEQIAADLTESADYEELAD